MSGHQGLDVSLDELKCKEHKVFDDDKGVHRVLWKGKANSIFREGDSTFAYYSFWLADHKGDPVVKKWFKLFQQSIECTHPLRGHLKKGDIFIFDNRKNLHARTEYVNPKRHLERHWIKA